MSTAANSPSPLSAMIRDEIASAGPMTLARFVELAMYHPEHGYYMARERRPGRPGDFITAPELHPFFGFTLARHLAECWEHLGQPDAFTVIEHGSGIGGLAYDIIAALHTHHPEVIPALRYRFNEVNPHRLAEATQAMAEAGLAHLVAPWDASADGPVTGVVLANEVADALPFHRLVVQDSELHEQYVVVDPATDAFAWQTGSLSPAVAESAMLPELRRLDLPESATLDVFPAAETWIGEIAGSLQRGFGLIIDYGYRAETLFSGHRLEGTARAHREHTVSADLLADPGQQDLTAHVDFTWLEQCARGAGMEPAGFTTQSDFLAQLGLGDFLMDLQQQPDTALEDYYRAQGAIFRLIDPGGLGRFGVLGLAKGVTTSEGEVPTLRGFSQPDLPPGLRHA